MVIILDLADPIREAAELCDPSNAAARPLPGTAAPPAALVVADEAEVLAVAVCGKQRGYDVAGPRLAQLGRAAHYLLSPLVGS